MDAWEQDAIDSYLSPLITVIFVIMMLYLAWSLSGNEVHTKRHPHYILINNALYQS